MKKIFLSLSSILLKMLHARGIIPIYARARSLSTIAHEHETGRLQFGDQLVMILIVMYICLYLGKKVYPAEAAACSWLLLGKLLLVTAG